jgi:hypothetical protein
MVYHLCFEKVKFSLLEKALVKTFILGKHSLLLLKLSFRGVNELNQVYGFFVSTWMTPCSAQAILGLAKISHVTLDLYSRS